MPKNYPPRYPSLDKKALEKLVGDTVFFANTQFQMQRALRLGLYWYVWHSSVCPKHKKMNNVFIRWSNPPLPSFLNDGSIVPHHAGDEWGCKCYAESVVDLSALNTRPPYKIYTGEKIVRMTKKEFLSNFGREISL